MTSKNKAFLTILVSVLLGGVAGIFVDRILLRGSFRNPSSSSRYERFKSQMFRDLDLTPSQQTQLEQLMERRQEVFNDLRKNIQAKYQEVRETTRDSIRGLLTSAQIEKYERLVKEFDTDRRQREKK